MAKTKVLIVDDEVDILDLLQYNLEKEGYKVLKAMDGQEAMDIAKSEKPQLILLDIMMPKLDGIETCRRIREIPGLNDAYIVFLTARAEEYSELAGFDAGADDYIAKPIKPRVLMSRIRAILRRDSSIAAPKSTIEIHGMQIFKDEYMVRKDGKDMTLPRKEFELLFFLASKPGKVFRREELLEKIWGDVYVVDRTIDVHIRKLREKIGDNYIITIKGVGYKFLSNS